MTQQPPDESLGVRPSNFALGDRVRFARRPERVLERVRVTSVFWGAEWETAELVGLRRHLRDFLGVLLQDDQVNALLNANTNTEIPESGRPRHEEPGVERRAPAAGRQVIPFFPGEHVDDQVNTSGPGPAVPESGPVPIDPAARPAGGAYELTDAAVRAMLREYVPQQSAEHTTNSLYMVFLPPATGVVRGPFRSCRDFCGYHDMIGGLEPPIVYAVIPYPDCAGCRRRLTERDALTVNASHELFNAVTDPVYGLGIFDPAQGEVADPCTGFTAELPGGDFLRRRIWSGGACQ